MPTRPTLKTISKMSGFGISTVSRALKDAPELAEATKQRIQLIARSLNYAPDPAGTALRSGKKQTVALVMDGDTIEGEAELVRGAAETLQEAGYSLLLQSAMGDAGKLAPVIHVMRTGVADGILIVRTSAGDERVRYLLDKGLPFVSYGRTHLGTQHAYYDFDHFGFAQLAVARLLDRGARRLVLVRSLPGLTQTRLLEHGFEQACSIRAVPHLVLHGINSDDPRVTFENAAMLFDRTIRVGDGIVVCSQRAVTPLISVLQARGVSLGSDVFLFARQVGNAVMFPHPQGMETAVEDVDLAGRELASLLLRRIGGEDPAGLQKVQRLGQVRMAARSSES